MKTLPYFSLPDQTGNIRTADEFSGKKILLYFYPKDMTPGCTTETIGFQETKPAFTEENTVIIGVSKDSVASHEKFCSKHSLDIILLSDEEKELITVCNVLKEKSMFGKKYIGVARESFLFDESGNLIHHWLKVKPLTHPKEVLDYIKDLS